MLVGKWIEWKPADPNPTRTKLTNRLLINAWDPLNNEAPALSTSILLISVATGNPFSTPSGKSTTTPGSSGKPSLCLARPSPRPHATLGIIDGNGLFFTVSPLDASHPPPRESRPLSGQGVIRSIGIIDWESAGYALKARIGTEFRVSMGLNLPGRDDDPMNDSRRSIQQRLGKEGLPRDCRCVDESSTSGRGSPWHALSMNTC